MYQRGVSLLHSFSTGGCPFSSHQFTQESPLAFTSQLFSSDLPRKYTSLEKMGSCHHQPVTSQVRLRDCPTPPGSHRGEPPPDGRGRLHPGGPRGAAVGELVQPERAQRPRQDVAGESRPPSACRTSDIPDHPGASLHSVMLWPLSCEVASLCLITTSLVDFPESPRFSSELKT